VPDRPAASVAERYDRAGLLAAVVVMAGWHAGFLLPIVIATWLRYGPWASCAAVWLAYAATGTASAVVLLRGRGHGPALPLAACPVLLAGVVTGGLAQPAGFFGSPNWPFVTAAFFALVAMWRRGIAALSAFLAANAIAGLGVLIALGQTDRVSIARFVGLCGGGALPLTLFAGSKLVTAMAGRAASIREELASARVAEQAAEAVQEDRRSRYETIRGTVTGLLRGLADGQLDPAEPATRQRIAVAVSRLRRYLVETDDVPDPLSHELRACADAAERHGVAVDLAAPAGQVPHLPVEVRRALTEPIITVLAAAATRARVTVVASPDHVAVAILADASLTGADRDALASGPGGAAEVSVDEEGGLLWAQAQWTGARASP